jgi:hypothetical protein
MSKEIIPIEPIAHLIFVFREQRVMLDSDLARLYGVSNGHSNRAVKRNAGRFPPDFMFQRSPEEVHFLKCQIGISKPARGRQLMAPPDKPRREIGFHVREKAPRYRARKRA